MARFTDGDVWRAGVQRPNDARGSKELTSTDINDLLGLFERGGGTESVAAFMVLRNVDRDPSWYPASDWNESARKRFRTELARQAKEFYVGARAWDESCTGFIRGWWGNVCAAECVDFVLTLDVPSLDAPIRQDVIERLSGAARERSDARSRVDELVALGGDISAVASEALEQAGIVRPERLQHFSRLWRENRDANALEWLYYRWISYLPVGFPKDSILEVLGPPTDGEFPDVYWAAHDDNHIYLEIYDHGLAGSHHT